MDSYAVYVGHAFLKLSSRITQSHLTETLLNAFCIKEMIFFPSKAI